MEITSDNDDDEDFDTSSANDSELKMVLVVNDGMILYLTKILCHNKNDTGIFSSFMTTVKFRFIVDRLNGERDYMVSG